MNTNTNTITKFEADAITRNCNNILKTRTSILIEDYHAQIADGKQFFQDKIYELITKVSDIKYALPKVKLWSKKSDKDKYNAVVSLRTDLMKYDCHVFEYSMMCANNYITSWSSGVTIQCGAGRILEFVDMLIIDATELWKLPRLVDTMTKEIQNSNDDLKDQLDQKVAKYLEELSQEFDEFADRLEVVSQFLTT